MTTTSVPDARLCHNCRRPPSKHRPWCGAVQARPEPPQVGDIVDDPIIGPSPLISVYLRQQAIEDGVLVDCTNDPFDELNRDVGMIFDVALTKAAFERYVEVPEQSMNSQDVKGRYWDIIWMFARAARRQPSNTALLFEFICLPNGSDCWPNEKHRQSPDQRLVQLKAVCSSGDRGEPCLTLMLPSED